MLKQAHHDSTHLMVRSNCVHKNIFFQLFGQFPASGLKEGLYRSQGIPRYLGMVVRPGIVTTRPAKHHAAAVVPQFPESSTIVCKAASAHLFPEITEDDRCRWGRGIKQGGTRFQVRVGKGAEACMLRRAYCEERGSRCGLRWSDTTTNGLIFHASGGGGEDSSPISVGGRTA